MAEKKKKCLFCESYVPKGKFICPKCHQWQMGDKSTYIVGGISFVTTLIFLINVGLPSFGLLNFIPMLGLGSSFSSMGSSYSSMFYSQNSNIYEDIFNTEDNYEVNKKVDKSTTSVKINNSSYNTPMLNLIMQIEAETYKSMGYSQEFIDQQFQSQFDSYAALGYTPEQVEAIFQGMGYTIDTLKEAYRELGYSDKEIKKLFKKVE